MAAQLQIAFGQHSSKGRKAVNQDFHAVMVPPEPQLGAKGVVVALADGISSSQVSQVASQTAVRSFLEDYYATPDSWTVKSSAVKVLEATNSWLYAQTRNGPYRYDIDKGYVCTFTALVLKSTRAHLFHAGDARVFRVVGGKLEQLTEDHRLWVSREKSYLSRALGMRERIEIDYHSFAIEAGDTFVLATDGVYEFVEPRFVAECIAAHQHQLDDAARMIVEEAYRQGSGDNMTVQIVRVEQVPEHVIGDLSEQAVTLPFPPELRPRMSFDGYGIVRELHHSHRNHVYLALDQERGEQVVLKVPSVDLRADAAYLERFLMEEWVARRLDNVHILKSCAPPRKRGFLYLVTEYIEGQTLDQWMRDNPRPELETVRAIVEQLARGLQAMHRQQMLHQDLRPSNIMIDRAGTVKIIDFGSVRVAGIAEASNPAERQPILGTAQYTAPEYFLGEPGTARSDLFSLAVITYEMLSGRLPYGARVARATTRAAQHRLVYESVLDDERTIPAWVDGALRKALNPNPYKRQDELSEFLHDLRRPSQEFMRKGRPPLMESHPILVWKTIALLLSLAVVALISTHPFFTQ